MGAREFLGLVFSSLKGYWMVICSSLKGYSSEETEIRTGTSERLKSPTPNTL